MTNAVAPNTERAIEAFHKGLKGKGTGGYSCPKCGGFTSVYDGRSAEYGFRRRRQCIHCLVRFTTYETSSKSNIEVGLLAARIERRLETIKEAIKAVEETLDLMQAEHD